ncbi:MAG: hypothetical protein JO092_10765 [Candidatus Eremiobacteraeota bacterium]|nr:hypothetical protein [Candidatus Eremiobacteraeota bacterium]
MVTPSIVLLTELVVCAAMGVPDGAGEVSGGGDPPAVGVADGAELGDGVGCVVVMVSVAAVIDVEHVPLATITLAHSPTAGAGPLVEVEVFTYVCR